MFGVESKTSGYLIREEIQKEKLRCRARRRAWSFERKLEERNGSELTRECWEKVKKIFTEGRQAQNRKGKEKDFFVERGLRIKEVEKRREEGGIYEPGKESQK